MEELRNSVQIYTDGSKLNGDVGSGIFSKSIGIVQSLRLPNHCTVSKRNVITLSDSQAAVRALNSNVTNSKIVYGCRRFVNGIAERYDIYIVWIPGHSAFPGNCRAEELAWQGATIQHSEEFWNLVPYKDLQAHN